MTEPPTIVVYCKGTTDAPHEPFIVARYRRWHVNPAKRSQWVQLPGTRQVERKVVNLQPGAQRSAWLRYRFRCNTCGFAQRRNEDEREFGGRMYAVFDGLWTHGADPLEVSVRGLLDQVDSAVSHGVSGLRPTTPGRYDLR